VSNIFTTAVRVYANPGARIDATEAEWITWMMLGPRGSYHVPVHIRLAEDGRHVDVQYGSGKSVGLVDFCADEVGYRYAAIWGRFYDEGRDRDDIWSEDVNDGPRRVCRYGFDEVRVVADDPPPGPAGIWRRDLDGSWRASVEGRYSTGNDRAAVGAAPGPGGPPPVTAASDMATQTTPNRYGEELADIDPPWLEPLADQHPGASLIEYYWRGRLVHRAQMEDDEMMGREWQHRCADDWDNCVDPEFLDFEQGLSGAPRTPGA